MRLLFPSMPFFPREPDPGFTEEIAAAEAAGFAWSLYALEDVRVGEPALVRCPPADGAPMLHRGWMMGEAAHERLCAAVRGRGYTPVVDAPAYAEAHYLPLAIRHLGAATPASVWNQSESEDDAWALYQRMADGDALLKDWVKSAKHRWREACFLPAGTDRARFGEIFRAFRAERGTLFERGVVVRRFHRLHTLGTDMRGMPIHEEHRLFFWRGALLASTAPSDVSGPLAHLDRWTELARRFASPFLTLDVAREADGGWIVVESGDGGVSGLPLALSPEVFYAALARVVAESPR